MIRDHEADYPNPPDNPEFEDLFTPEGAAEIDRRFQVGIKLGETNTVLAHIHAQMAGRERARMYRERVTIKADVIDRARRRVRS